ncbi:MAG: hypothetical protein LH630_05830 [Actinomycetia bacterium]|nr:hypothetical protein [Actinomycetes bacterium]
MIEAIEDPMAFARVAWLTAEEGGRKSGPPTAPVYAATCVFPLGGDSEVQPGWPAAGDALSILLQAAPTGGKGPGTYKVDFLARDLARQFLHVGAEVLVMEGPAVVARAVILEVTDSPEQRT